MSEGKDRQRRRWANGGEVKDRSKPNGSITVSPTEASGDKHWDSRLFICPDTMFLGKHQRGKLIREDAETSLSFSFFPTISPPRSPLPSLVPFILFPPSLSLSRYIIFCFPTERRGSGVHQPNEAVAVVALPSRRGNEASENRRH